MTHTLAIEYDDSVLLSVGLSEQEFNAEARFLLAAKLYELGRLSSGQSASFCGMGRVEFLCALPRAGVAMSNLRPEDATSEIEFFRTAEQEGQPASEVSGKCRPYRTQTHDMGLKPGMNLDNIQELLAKIEGEDSR